VIKSNNDSKQFIIDLIVDLNPIGDVATFWLSKEKYLQKKYLVWSVTVS